MVIEGGLNMPLSNQQYSAGFTGSRKLGVLTDKVGHYAE
jgi:hypothetical protein